MHKKRLCTVYFLFLTAIALICVRLYTIATDGSFAEKALSGQYTRRIDIANRRGFIFDRNGVLCDMVQNGYAVFADPSEIPTGEYKEYAEKLSAHSKGDASYYFEKLYSSVPFVSFSEKEIELQGIKCYPLYSPINTEHFCHIVGYCNSDGNGVSGIRKAYDDALNISGTRSVSARYTANAKGAELGSTDTEIEDNGYNEKSGVYLTVDSDIQKAVEDVCTTYLEKGAVVIQDINSGEIISCVSIPSYNTSDIISYLDSENGELLNRAFLGYTPGSVFKTVVAASALQEDISLIDLEYECNGYIEISGTKISCHKKDGHGRIKMREAFSNSCNPYFISLISHIGAENVIDTAKQMGIGRIHDIDGLYCAKGYLPDTSDMKSVDEANTAIGQGSILVTPIEMNTVMTCAVTGNFTPPVLVEKLVTDSGDEYPERDKKQTVLPKDTVAALRSMLCSCVNNGTGYRVKNSTVSCGGKTATAQSGQIKDGNEVIHSWFSGFFPTDTPQYAVTVLCDGNGKNNAHPSDVFRMIAESIGE